jgi:hypothetical protein
MKGRMIFSSFDILSRLASYPSASVGGSVAREIAASVSMMRLSQSSYITEKGEFPREMLLKRTINTQTMLIGSWN